MRQTAVVPDIADHREIIMPVFGAAGSIGARMSRRGVEPCQPVTGEYRPRRRP